MNKAAHEGLARLWQCSEARYRAGLLCDHDPADVIQVLKILKITDIPSLLTGLRKEMAKA